MKNAINDLGYQYLGVEGEKTGDLEDELERKDLEVKETE